MPRYFMHLAYCGAPFHGWQRQPADISVQQVIEEALATILRCETPIVGAGRTDTGVNARCMVAHFDVDETIADPDRLVGALNSLVGKDIAIYSIRPVADDAHARFDAISRTYHYYVSPTKSPFFHNLVWKSPADLDFEAMNEAASYLLSVSDFTSFAKLHSDAKTNICHVTEAEWRPVPGTDAHVFVITADRFLRNMVRAVVGTLIEVGRRKMTLKQFREVIDACDRCAAGTSMPPHPLYLWNVEYPYYSFSNV